MTRLEFFMGASKAMSLPRFNSQIVIYASDLPGNLLSSPKPLPDYALVFLMVNVNSLLNQHFK